MTEPLVLINLLTLPPQAVDGFVAGFRGTRLHRAVLSDSPFQLASIAGWNSAEDGQSAMVGQQHGGEQHPSALYRVVSVTPDPLAVLAAC